MCEPGFSKITELDHSLGREKVLLGNQTTRLSLGVWVERTAKEGKTLSILRRGVHGSLNSLGVSAVGGGVQARTV